MRKSLLFTVIATLAACSLQPAAVQFQRAEEQRAKQYHQLQANIKAGQTTLNSFATDWLAICKAKGQVLTMDATGDPACVTTSTSALPNAPDQRAIGMKGTIKTEAPPEKK